MEIPTLNPGKSEQKSEPVLPKKGTRNILITSALPYVNNVPHLGNIVGSTLSGDVFARFCRRRGYTTLYVCGTDEYGTATETKAIQEKLTPKEICDKYFKVHKEVYEWFGLQFDIFGRTSTEWQTKITQDIFNKLNTNGCIFENSVQQFYCETCKMFLADRFVEGVCPHCGFGDARGDQCDGCARPLNPADLKEPRCKLDRTTPIIRSSEHLFLDLVKLRPKVEDWLPSSSYKWSSNAQSITKEWLKNLDSRCITRDLKWGTPVPVEKFKDKVFYVWFDACFGYVSITANYTKDWEQWWKTPENDVELIQFMGKDNVTFHTVQFPASLLGTQDPWVLLSRISSTEYLNYESGKFSKSRGVGVFGDGARDSGFSADVWRFYLLRNRPENADTTFLWGDFAAKYDGELIAAFGNLINRVLSFCKSTFESTIPSIPSDAKDSSPFLVDKNDKDLIEGSEQLVLQYLNDLEHIKLKDGLEKILQISHLGNQYLQKCAPWNLIKTDAERCKAVLALGARFVRLLATLVEPFMPNVAATICKQLGLAAVPDLPAGPSVHPNKSDENSFVGTTVAEIREFFFANSILEKNHKIGVPEPLFPKLDKVALEALKKKHAGQENNNVVSDIKFTKQPEIKWPCAIVHFKDMKIKRNTKDTDKVKAEMLQGIDLKAVESLPHVIAYDKLNQGMDQSKFMNSVLNLSNLLKNSKNGQLPNINVFVDIYNLFSLKYGIVGGAYDRAAIQGDLTYTLASGEEHFIPLGLSTAEKIQPGEWILKDSKDRVMTKLVTKQASYSAITLSTKECVLCLQGNPETTLEYLEDVAKQLGAQITKACGGTFNIIHLK